MFLFFSVARSQEIGHWERAEAAPAASAASKTAKNAAPAFAPHMPLMSSAFDTSALLVAA
jgi:hypothetical protein